MTKLEIQYINPQVLLPDPENPRYISDEALEDLSQSLDQYGFIQPVIYNKRTQQIVGGHQRVKAAIKKGLTKVPVIFVDWSKKKQKSANLALNKITGEWDNLKLEDYIKSIDLTDIESDDLDSYITGFTEEDLKDLPSFEEQEENSNPRLDKKKEIECPKCGELFET